MSVPAHIAMIQSLLPNQRTQEEAKMLADYQTGSGDYGEGGKFEETSPVYGGGWPESARSGLQDNYWNGGSGKKEWNSKAFKRCYEDHPALPIILKDGTERLVYGGSCSSPIHAKCDIYVGLDYSMKKHSQRLPWVPGHAIHYEIKDGSIPTNLPEFKLLIEWLAVQVDAGQKVHVGCIGGHGRTGMVLAALVAHMTDLTDPITYVRKNYCHKAVESKVQVNMLMKEFGCVKVKGSKESLHKGFSSSYSKPKKNTVSPVKAASAIWPDYDMD